MPVLKRGMRQDTTDNTMEAGVGEGQPPMMAAGGFVDPTKKPGAPDEARDKTSPREAEAEKTGGYASQAPVVRKSPQSAALQGGAANVTQARGGGLFDESPGALARSLSSRPMFGSQEGLMGGGLGVPGLTQTGSAAQTSPLLMQLMKLFGQGA